MKVIAYSYLFQEMFFTKDIFLVPYYIAKEYGIELEYVYGKNLGDTEIPMQHRGVKISHDSSNALVSLLKHVVLHAKDVSILFIWGCGTQYMLAVRLYKLLNPKGRVVVFGDMELPQAQELNRTNFLCPNGIKGVIKKCLTKFFMNNTTFIVANTEAYNEMRKLCDRHHWKGLLHFYPCLDDEMFNEYGMKRKSWGEKENIMICVGRIGNYQKNTEMLLEALKTVDLKDWKIYMIGPITSSFDLNEKGDFQKIIDQFFIDNPQHKRKVIFTGMIYNQRDVIDYYNRAKVLISTSRHEGFANIYSQAAAFGCYIVSTDVGGADVASNQWKFGRKLEQEDADGLSNAIQSMVDGKLVLDESQAYRLESMSYSYRVNKILLPKIEVETY